MNPVALNIDGVDASLQVDGAAIVLRTCDSAKNRAQIYLTADEAADLAKALIDMAKLAMRGSSTEERLVHNQGGVGATPTPATKTKKAKEKKR